MLSIAVLDLAGIIQLSKSAERSPVNTAQSTGHSAVKSNLLNKAASSLATMTMAPSTKRAKKPNIVIIWGDDIGQSNISAYSMGMMGYRTPNIDRVAKEGMIFTDYYAEQSCTAGRASFLTGQHGLRTGLTKVGLPGAKLGLSKKDPTVAEILKSQGYSFEVALFGYFAFSG